MGMKQNHRSKKMGGSGLINWGYMIMEDPKSKIMRTVATALLSVKKLLITLIDFKWGSLLGV